MANMRIMAARIFLFLLIIITSCRISASGSKTAEEMAAKTMEQTMVALYQFNFSLADSLSGEMLVKYPDHYLSHFTRAQYLWWLIITNSPNATLETGFNGSVARSLKAIDRFMTPDRPHIHTFFYINIYAMQARLYLKNKEYLRTILSLKNCIDQIELSLGNEADFMPYNLSSGMYNYMSEYSTRRFPFLGLYTLLYPKGNMKLGLDQLSTAAESENQIWRTEAAYLLMRIYFEIENDSESALFYGERLTREFPDNLIFQWYYLQIAETIDTGVPVEKLRTSLIENTRKATGINQYQKAYLLSIFGK